MGSYIDYYGLRDFPFGITPNIEYYCDFEGQKDLLDNILVAVGEGDSFIKVIGGAGVGKTLLLRRLLASFDDSFVICCFFSSDFTATGLRIGVAENLGLVAQNYTPSRLLSKINDKLLDLNATGKKFVLIIDEAQSLTDDALEALRMLTNLETRNKKLLQVLMLAQPSLDDRLYAGSFEQFLQRITMSLYIMPLKTEDFNVYLIHRLVVAGHPSGLLFTDAAKKMLYKLSNGIPRIINVLCSKSLILSYQRGLPYVDVAEINHCLSECCEIVPLSKQKYARQERPFSFILVGMVFFIGVLCWLSFDFFNLHMRHII
ncbi:MAG: AAA family ATPase [Legionellales bacterium]|jgi:MSHA biogenesis protein MshM|nr:AAA family ATPase [Legionellales bacterium]